MKDARSLRSSPWFERFVLDQLADLGPVTSRKMFGGIGLHCGGVSFGIIDGALTAIAVRRVGPGPCPKTAPQRRPL